MTITYNLVLREIKKLSFVRIKVLLGRERLRFSQETIAKYLFLITKHQQRLVNYKTLYKEEKPDCSYQNFIKNINLMSRLMQPLFYQFNRQYGVIPSEDYNSIDTTIIEEKSQKSINKKDWNRKRVTTRNGLHYCGSKGLFFLNQHGFITRADRIDINQSDHNILKEIRYYSAYLRGNVLADRGFSSKLVRKRFVDANNDHYQPLFYPCKLISPYKKLSKEQLSPEEKLLYKNRWQIETLFQRMKDIYGVSRLLLKGKYTEQHKQAKFYASAILYNLSVAG